MSRSAGVILIGYSGHAFVVCDILDFQHATVEGYCEKNKKENNPYDLMYLGQEKDCLDSIRKHEYFVAIGDNGLRRTISQNLMAELDFLPIKAIHSSSIVSESADLAQGVMIGPGAVVNSQVVVGSGTICNTRSVVEHECEIGEYCHIAPGAVLCGAVILGEGSFIGAGAVVKEGVIIGSKVLIGAGTVVIKDIPDNSVVVGNPQRFI